MAPLTGLTGLNGATPPDIMDAGVADAHHAPGTVTGTGHGQYGDTSGQSWPAAFGSGWDGTSYGPDVLIDDQNGGMGKMAASGYIDKTPDVHCSPYPDIGLSTMDGVTQESINRAVDARAAQRHALHGKNLGGKTLVSQFSPAGRETPVDYTVDRYESPNATMLSENLSGQLKSAGTGGGAGKDTSQGLGQLNPTDEFAHGHSIRIIQHDPMHWDRSLDYSPPQPFWGRKEIREARFDVDSPYQQAGDTSTGQQVVWEGRIGFPTAYQPPAEPVIHPPSPNALGEDVWAY